MTRFSTSGLFVAKAPPAGAPLPSCARIPGISAQIWVPRLCETLTIMCGGDRDVVDRVRPYLDHIGSKIFYIWNPPAAGSSRTHQPLLFDINAAALGEILPMAVKMGLDPDLVGPVVNSGTGRSYASEFFIPRILRGEFRDGHHMSHAYKDLVSAAELSANNCISCRCSPLPRPRTRPHCYADTATRTGDMVRVFEDLLDVAYRSGSTPTDTLGATHD